MLELILYSFSKKVNSTKRPTSPGEVINVSLKGDTSLINPSFIISDHNAYKYNYCKFEGRYYWIDDITYLNNSMYELSCSIDVLATYYTNIINSTQYVTRSYTLSDPSVIDGKYPTKGYSTFKTTNITNPYGSISDSWYLLGVIGPAVYNDELSGYSTGAIQYYLLNSIAFNQVLYFMMQDNVETSTYFNVPEEVMNLQLQKAILNPLKYFAFCKRVPGFIHIDDGSHVYLDHYSVNNIKLGWNYEIPLTVGASVKAYAIKPITLTLTGEVTLEKHPLSNDRGTYLNLSPYSQYSLYLEPFGLVPLDTTKLFGLDKITWKMVLDEITGNTTLTVTGGSNIRSNDIAFVTGNIYVDVQLAQISQDYYGQQKASIAAASSSLQAVTGAASIATGGDIAKGINNIGQGVLGTQSAIIDSNIASIPQMEKSGSNGSQIIYTHQPCIHSVFRDIVGEDKEHYGRPYMKRRILSSFSGYVQCENAVVDIAATSSEIDQITAYLNGGFYIE